MDKKFLAIFYSVVFLFALFGCNKKDSGPVSMKNLFGEWKLQSKFWDLDSNGYDSGDIVYLAKPSDSIIWDFTKDSKVNFKSKGVTYLLSNWGLTTLHKGEKMNHLYFQNDPDELVGYNYNIQKIDQNNLIIFCRQLYINSSGYRSYRWRGYVLMR